MEYKQQVFNNTLTINTMKYKKKEIKEKIKNQIKEKFKIHLIKNFIQKIKRIKKIKLKEEIQFHKFKKRKIISIVRFLKNFAKKEKLNKAFIKAITKKCLDNSKMYNQPKLAIELQKSKQKDKIKDNNLSHSFKQNLLSFNHLQKILIKKTFNSLEKKYGDSHNFQVMQNHEQEQEIKYDNNLLQKKNYDFIEIKKEFFLDFQIYTTKEIINTTDMLSKILNEIWAEKNKFSEINLNNINYNKKYENVEFENKEFMLVIKAKETIREQSKNNSNLYFNISIFVKWTFYLLDKIININNFIFNNDISLNRFTHCVAILEVSQRKSYYLNILKEIFAHSCILSSNDEPNLKNSFENDLKQFLNLNKKVYLFNVNDNEPLETIQFANRFFEELKENFNIKSTFLFENELDGESKQIEKELRFYPIVGRPLLREYYGSQNCENFFNFFSNEISLIEFPKMKYFELSEILRIMEKLFSSLYFTKNNLFINDQTNAIFHNYDYLSNRNYEINVSRNCYNYELEEENDLYMSNYLISKITNIQHPSWIKFFIMVINIKYLLK